MNTSTEDVIGLTEECFIVGIYSQDGLVLCRIVDPLIDKRARKQARQAAYEACLRKISPPKQ